MREFRIYNPGGCSSVILEEVDGPDLGNLQFLDGKWVLELENLVNDEKQVFTAKELKTIAGLVKTYNVENPF